MIGGSEIGCKNERCLKERTGRGAETEAIKSDMRITGVCEDVVENR